jgi:hypothetical protein
MLPDIQSLLVAALTSITPRIYRTEAEENATAPFAVWSIVSGVPENNISGAPENDNSRIQIDCYSLSQNQAKQMGYLAMAAVEAVNLANVIFGPVESREPDTKLWRWQFDISTWKDR